jgi:hypothetical protein
VNLRYTSKKCDSVTRWNPLVGTNAPFMYESWILPTWPIPPAIVVVVSATKFTAFALTDPTSGPSASPMPCTYITHQLQLCIFIILTTKNYYNNNNSIQVYVLIEFERRTNDSNPRRGVGCFLNANNYKTNLNRAPVWLLGTNFFRSLHQIRSVQTIIVISLRGIQCTVKFSNS